MACPPVVAAMTATDAPPATRGTVGRRTVAVVLLAAGWIALVWSTSLALLASIQAGMIGLGFIGSAIVAVLWPARKGRPS